LVLIGQQGLEHFSRHHAYHWLKDFADGTPTAGKTY
jgi:hypothetical protein